MVAYTTTKMSDAPAYQLTKTYWQTKATMGQAAAWWNGVNKGLMANITGKFHPGAQRYYREAGIALSAAQQ